jgi:hypothetical protein
VHDIVSRGWIKFVFLYCILYSHKVEINALNYNVIALSYMVQKLGLHVYNTLSRLLSWYCNTGCIEDAVEKLKRQTFKNPWNEWSQQSRDLKVTFSHPPIKPVNNVLPEPPFFITKVTQDLSLSLSTSFAKAENKSSHCRHPDDVNCFCLRVRRICYLTDGLELMWTLVAGLALSNRQWQRVP